MARGGTRPNAGRKPTKKAKSKIKKPRVTQQRLKTESNTYTLVIPADLLERANAIRPSNAALDDFLREMLSDGLKRREARLEDDRRPRATGGISHLVRNVSAMERAYGGNQ
jgi:hypothetical protein